MTGQQSELPARRDRLASRAYAVGYRLQPLDVPPADSSVALTVEIALCKAALANRRRFRPSKPQGMR
ncbi:hypothetical protein [Streptomyces sp. NPDC058268]|uniref:hypothetical protein n=1 Tax=Streptomyces sp. NPDC058268 TaxID=3346413 RepID=UPI0036E7FB29